MKPPFLFPRFSFRSTRAFTLIEVLVATAVFLLFALGVYGGITLVLKIVYQSRLRIIETALLSEELEVARALPYESVGILNGVPPGLLSHEKTVNRNNVAFNLVTTVRNIDDPFDGTAGGSPNDTSPADYKLVEMSAICASCSQQEPVILNTIVAPKQLEGASQNGHLFIQVFDAGGLPLPGASVHVVNGARTPNTIIDDVTGNDGWLRIVDTPTGTLSYHVTVGKSGYSSDYTVSSSPANPNPVKLPATVAAQTVTEIYFSIDALANLNLHTLDSGCAALGSKTVRVWNDKLIGLEPEVYKFDQTIATDASGNYAFSNMEWGNYSVSAEGTSYDVAGTIPISPTYLTPGMSQEFSVVLRPHTTRSLLVKVLDAGTKLPLSDASVRLYGGGYDSTLDTGVGYLRQTNWVGGGGQADYINETKYYSDDGKLAVNSPAGDVKLKKVGQYYYASGYLESSTFNAGAGVDWRNLIFLVNQPGQCGVNSIRAQIATATSSNPGSWNFTGPDGTAGTFYTPTSTIIHAFHDGRQYLRYRVYLSTANTRFTPTLSEIAFTYTNACVPPGQAFFYGLSSGTYNLEVTRAGYDSAIGEVEVSDNNETVVNLSVSE